MFKTLILIYLISLISFVYSANYQYATCVLTPETNKDITGSVYFALNSTTNKLYVSTSAKGSAFTSNAAIVHNNGNLYSSLYSTTIFNPSNQEDTCDKIGILGNLATDNLNIILEDRDITGVNSLVGLTFALYSNEISCPTFGDLGDILAKCVIGIGKFETIPDDVRNQLGTITSTDTNTAMNAVNNDAAQSAICKIVKTDKFVASSDEPLSGSVYFKLLNSGKTQITAQFNGLVKNSIHGLHIHSLGDLNQPEAGLSIGGHWKSPDQTHGLPETSTREYGDLGNVCQYVGNTAYYSWSTDYFPYNSTNNIIGRAMALHQLRDNGTTFGDRWGWCVIGLMNPSDPSPFNVPDSISTDTPICVETPTENPTLPAPQTTTTTTTPIDPSSASLISISIFFMISLIILQTFIF